MNYDNEIVNYDNEIVNYDNVNVILYLWIITKLIIQLNKIMEISSNTQSVKESIRPSKHTVALNL